MFQTSTPSSPTPIGIEVNLPSREDRIKLQTVLEDDSSFGYNIQTPEEYEASKEKLWCFTGLIKLDRDDFTIQDLNKMVLIHKWKKDIRGVLRSPNASERHRTAQSAS